MYIFFCLLFPHALFILFLFTLPAFSDIFSQDCNTLDKSRMAYYCYYGQDTFLSLLQI
jgi:hypothetical protein